MSKGKEHMGVGDGKSKIKATKSNNGGVREVGWSFKKGRLVRVG